MLGRACATRYIRFPKTDIIVFTVYNPLTFLSPDNFHIDHCIKSQLPTPNLKHLPKPHLSTKTMQPHNPPPPFRHPPHRHDHRPQPSPLTPPLACHLYHLLPREHEKLVGFKMRRPSVDGYGTFPSQADPRSIEGTDTIIKISTVTWLPALEKLLGPGLLLGVASE